MTPLFALYPGQIGSEDGELIHVGAQQLSELYNVPLTRCVVIRNEEDEQNKKEQLKSVMHLHPRWDGRYMDLSEHVETLDRAFNAKNMG